MTILVAHASKHGSAAEIAEAIAERLRHAGLEVECRAAGDVASVTLYSAVVLGSAVYMKRWRPEARRFLRRHAAALADRPFWIFSSGPVGPPADDKPGWSEPQRAVQSAERLGVREHVVFGGRLPTDGTGFAARAMADGTAPEFRDRRDWEAVGAWADGIAAALRTPVR